MDSKRIFDVVIVGGGPAGYTAALYATRAGLSTAIIEKMAAGGQMCETTAIENYPGFDTVDGYTLGDKMKNSAEQFGAKTITGEVRSLSLKEDQKVAVTDAETIYSKSVIIATGATHRHLGMPRERELTGRGVAYCAACDGMFYRGKRVVVVGGGNSAAADALLLSGIASHVTIVHRRDTLRASRVYHAPLMARENVTFLFDSEVIEPLGENKLSGVRVRNKKTGEITELEAEGLFISIGRDPATELVKGQLTLDESGYIVAGEDTKTNLAGVFAAGDVRTKPLRQIVTATADGAVAASEAELYLANHE